MLKPVHDSYNSERPIAWHRVHNLARFVYFDHSIHVAKGIGCAACHGRVDEMPLTYQENSLLMEWCCSSATVIRGRIAPREKRVFSMTWQPPADRADFAEQMRRHYRI